MSQELSPQDIQAIRRAYERVSERGWGLALGTVAALTLFLATIILVVKGGPHPGPHLKLLGEYLPGYRITWPGAFLGACYAFAIGYITGRVVGMIYNRLIQHR